MPGIQGFARYRAGKPMQHGSVAALFANFMICLINCLAGVPGSFSNFLRRGSARIALAYCLVKPVVGGLGPHRPTISRRRRRTY